jgi:tetratricopeptide (TPR) repeat protein
VVIATTFGLAVCTATGLLWLVAFAATFDRALTVAGVALGVVAIPLGAYLAINRPDTVAADGAPPRIVSGHIPAAPKSAQPRTSLLTQISDQHAAGHIAIVTTLTGGRGVGKTQLAATYARNAAEHAWPVVAWIDSQTEDLIIDGLLALADRAGLPPQPTRPDGAQAALDWLGRHDGPCLLVYDNAEDADLIDRWKPTTGECHILITAISATLANLTDQAHAIHVDAFTDAEASAYIEHRTGLTDPDGAATLAAELDNLPLALAQAAAIIGPGKPHPSIDVYLDRLSHTTIDAQLHHVPGSGYPLGMAKAVLLSVAQLHRDDPTGRAAQLLDLLAVLAPTGIAIDLLAPDRDTATDQATALLVDRALATITTDGTTISMHRLTQRIIREALARDDQLATIREKAADLISNAVPADINTRSAWERCALLLPHARLVCDPTNHARWAIALAIGNSGDLHTAVAEWQTLVSSHETALGPHDPYALHARGNLALITGEAGAYQDAIGQYQQLLPDLTRTLGPDHPDSLKARNNLAMLIGFAGAYQNAIGLYHQLLPDLTRILGPDHPTTLAARSNLAIFSGETGAYQDAIGQFQQLLSDLTRTVGPDHATTLQARGNLAIFSGQTGAYQDAIDQFQQLLPDLTRTLGPDHPDTLEARGNLAVFSGEAGAYQDAIGQFQQLLPDLARTLGPDHPDTLQARGNLARLAGEAGAYQDAIDQFQQLLPDLNRTLGPDHPDTLRARANLATFTGEAGAYQDAIDQFQQLLPDLNRTIGPDHPTTLQARGNLAIFSAEAGAYQDAIDQFQQLLPDLTRTLGPHHPTTLKARNKFSRLQAEAQSATP